MERTAVAALVTAAMLVTGCSESATPADPTTDDTPAAASSITAAAPPTAPPTTLAASSDEGPLRDVRVPARPAPVVDGTLEAGEWMGAARTTLDDDTEVWWLHAGGSLYVGIDGDEAGAVNLVLAVGDEVRMLHSSAALGSALYAGDGEVWRLEHGFDWCCRSRTDDTDARALFTSEGWTANIGFQGAPGDVEFRVAWNGGTMRAAISSIAPDATVAFWPTDLDDDAREALHGERRDLERFAAWTWPEITPEG